MNAHSQALVHHLLASHLRVDEGHIEDSQTFAELGLDGLDLVFIVLRLEDLGSGEGEFPLHSLEHATTVADFVALVDRWLLDDPMPSSAA